MPGHAAQDEQVREHIDDVDRPEPARYPNGQALVGELVDDVEQAELAPVMGALLDKVVGLERGWGARPSAGCTIRPTARGERASAAGWGPSAPRVDRSARPACRGLASRPDAETRRSCDIRSGHIAWPTRRCRRSIVLHRHGPRGILRFASSGAAPSAAQARRSEITATAPRTCSMQARRRARLSSFLCRLLQDQLAQRQLGHRATKPRVLRLQVPQALNPWSFFSPPKLLAPAVIRHLRSHRSHGSPSAGSSALAKSETSTCRNLATISSGL